ncbi:MAG: HigA family addiction module antitoxin [Azospirillaceae bacterium]
MTGVIESAAVVSGPIHPGRILREEFLEPYGLSANRLARAIGVPANRITAILNGTRGITGETAMLLGAAFGMTPEFWLNLQKRYELDSAADAVAPERLAGAEALFRDLRASEGG